MGIEIERKYLVKNDDYRNLAKGILYVQGFLNSQKERVVRVRIIGEKGFLTIKGPTKGISRLEFEYEIPVWEAETLLDKLCEKPIIKKYRYTFSHAEHIWEVDEFLDENEGLVIAEIELDNENQKITLPDWIGDEVTSEPAYYNSNLIRNPFCNWER